MIGFIPFPRVLVKCNQSRLGFELVSLSPFPTTITITPRAPLLIQLIVFMASHLADPVIAGLNKAPMSCIYSALM